MIKFIASTQKHEILIGFGLSRENINALVLGHPILVDCKELGFENMAITIFFGETEERMKEDMREFIGDHTLYINRKKGVEN